MYVESHSESKGVQTEDHTLKQEEFSSSVDENDLFNMYGEMDDEKFYYIMQAAGRIPIPLNVKLTGQLPSFELEPDDQEKWMINEVDRNRIRRQLLNKIKIDVDIVRRLLPKQVDLKKFLKNLEYKVIHDYKIPLSVKELKAEYQSSPWFQDIYKYVRTGFCRYTGHAKFAFKKSCEDYFLINNILFKLKYDSNMDEMTTVLCIPEKYIPIILHQYHDEV